MYACVFLLRRFVNYEFVNSKIISDAVAKTGLAVADFFKNEFAKYTSKNFPRADARTTIRQIMYTNRIIIVVISNFKCK